MSDLPSPTDLIRTGTELAWMTVEAQSVIAMRMMGLAGLWSVGPSEATRMILEKPETFGQAALAAQQAMMSGKQPHEVLDAAIKPLRAKTRANSRRLARRGISLP